MSRIRDLSDRGRVIVALAMEEGFEIVSGRLGLPSFQMTPRLVQCPDGSLRRMTVSIVGGFDPATGVTWTASHGCWDGDVQCQGEDGKPVLAFETALRQACGYRDLADDLFLAFVADNPIRGSGIDFHP